ncbi:MAG: hypothetical protein NT039_01035 [Candidatus Berkelbacteria bacterium]|nr:hypothetical protein [Candidatus Berkelbacteria bacterium]
MGSLRMIKQIIIFCVVSVLILIPAGEALAYQIDQHNDSSPLTPVNIHSFNFLAQTFKPKFPTLNLVTVYLGIGGGQLVTIKLVRDSNGQTILSSQQNINNAYSWVSMPAPGSGLAVTPGEVLKIEITTDSRTMCWQVGENLYDRGEAYYGGTPQDSDFYFRVYGTPPPPATSSPGSSSSVAPLPSGTQGAAPAATTDKSIDVPKNFKAADISNIKNNEPKVKLTWDRSETSDVDGYRIYAKDDSSQFGLVTEINKDTNEYEDINVSFDKKYTYMVRAFRNNAESDSSNEATVTPNKAGKSLKTFGFISDNTLLWKQWHFWALVALLLAIIAFVTWYIVDRMKRKKAENVGSLKS